MKEIGGYFGFEDLVHKEFHSGLIALNTGRNALCYAVKAYGIKKIYTPYYLCRSIENMLKNNNIPYEKYHVDEKFEPVFSRKLENDEYILIVNYYGQICEERALDLQNRYSNVVLDNTHAFFQTPLPGMPTFCSCRKFFGVADGAYLAAEKRLNLDLETDVSKDRMKHLLGRYEGCASDHYSDSRKNDAALASEPVKLMSRLTANILGAVDHKKVLKKRSENFLYLDGTLKGMNPLELAVPDGPFAYPFYSENAVEIRRNAAEKKIYIPLLWPGVLEDEGAGETEKRYARNILPLPCDQRYGRDEMEKIVMLLHEGGI